MVKMLNFIVIYALIGIIYYIVSALINMRNKEERTELEKEEDMKLESLWLEIKKAIKANCNFTIAGILKISLILPLTISFIGFALVTWPCWMVAFCLAKTSKKKKI